jgi:formylglycine-generating enzyme required for sulfatase activity
MEQNKNDRLADLFNQAKNEPVKTSFEETKTSFLKATAGYGKVTKMGKITQFMNFKLILMITTLCTVAVGTALFFNGISNSRNPEEKLREVNPIIFSDSAMVVEEHNNIVHEYVKKVSALAPHMLSNDTNKRRIKKRKHKTVDKAWYQKEQGIVEINRTETVENYRFPNLNEEEWQAHDRLMAKMFKKTKREKNPKPGKWSKKDPYGYLFVPMGTYVRKGKIQSVPAFYMKQTEVSNLDYRTFLFELLKQDKKEEFLKAKPDQSRWVKDYPYAFNKPMQENYFSHPAYDTYPAVGMSREGAEMYCKWFTEELNRVAGAVIVETRLPTNYEWEYAAKGGIEKSTYPWEGSSLRNSEGCFLANFKPGVVDGDQGCAKDYQLFDKPIKAINNPMETKEDVHLPKNLKNPYSADGGFFTVPVNSYLPNGYDLYCMAGNVAEMVMDENKNPVTKGGSWTSTDQELQIITGKDRFKGLIGPSVDVGFRPILTFINKK